MRFIFLFSDCYRERCTRIAAWSRNSHLNSRIPGAPGQSLAESIRIFEAERASARWSRQTMAGLPAAMPDAGLASPAVVETATLGPAAAIRLIRHGSGKTDSARYGRLASAPAPFLNQRWSRCRSRSTHCLSLQKRRAISMAQAPPTESQNMRPRQKIDGHER